jgi:hypothetical protein
MLIVNVSGLFSDLRRTFEKYLSIIAGLGRFMSENQKKLKSL